MNYISKIGTMITLDGIITDYCAVTGITLEQYKSKTRKREIAKDRQIFMWLLSTLKGKLNLSYSDIGRVFGRDHATAIHSKNKVNGYIEVGDPMGDRAKELYKKVTSNE